ncbi:MAG: hypothetical protein WB791_08675 [Waddliaceae bacterium]
MQCLFSEEPLGTGTLIVTYQTDAERDRLSRIRFWLKNEDNKQRIYPKGKTYVDEPNEPTRKVVIENLAEGEYCIEFLVPNVDHHFEAVPLRKVKVVKGEATKIDQVIKPRRTAKEEPVQEVFGRLLVSFDVDPDFSQNEPMAFSLVDDFGHVTIHPTPGQDTEVMLTNGRMIRTRKLPARSYILAFSHHDDQKSLLFPEKRIVIEANKSKSIHLYRSITEVNR